MQKLGVTWLALMMLVAVAGTLVPNAARADISPDENAIRAVLNDQTAAWNAGDLDRFMQGYEDSPQTTFIGRTIRHGHSDVLAYYKKNYPSKAKMGSLTFTDIDVRMLCPSDAVVTGRFKLTFPETGAPEQTGIFSLVWAKTSAGWKVLLDHTSAAPTS
jgi:uncharacterized protein (TIGR02246 family)